MSAFRFPLQKVLELRRRQLELAEAQYQQRAAALAALDHARAETEAAGASANREVRRWNPIAGQDLSALDRFRLRLKSESVRIAARREDAARQTAEQRAAMLEARRRSRLLEKLKERRLAEWKTARDRELEELAGDSFLAGWNRRQGDPDNSS
jgi:flagellar export protein FliJ